MRPKQRSADDKLRNLLEEAAGAAEDAASEATTAAESCREALATVKELWGPTSTSAPLEPWWQEIDRLLGATPGLPLLPHERVERVRKLAEDAK